jgi:hypothetical protein
MKIQPLEAKRVKKDCDVVILQGSYFSMTSIVLQNG